MIFPPSNVTSLLDEKAIKPGRRRIVTLAIVVTLALLCAACEPPADSNARYSVVVTAIDQEWKIRAIKAIREETGLGLADAKNLVESTPSVVKSSLTKADAEAVAARLRDQRMTVEIKRDL